MGNGLWDEYDRMVEEITRDRIHERELESDLQSVKTSILQKTRRCQEIRAQIEHGSRSSQNAAALGAALILEPQAAENDVEVDHAAYLLDTAKAVRSAGRPVTAEDIAKQFGIEPRSASARLSRTLKEGLIGRTGRGQYVAIDEVPR